MYPDQIRVQFPNSDHAWGQIPCVLMTFSRKRGFFWFFVLCAAMCPQVCPSPAIYTGSHCEYGALHAKYHCIAELNPRADEHSRKSPSPCSDDIRLLHCTGKTRLMFERAKKLVDCQLQCFLINFRSKLCVRKSKECKI